MINYALLIATVVVMSHAQRPPYAGSPNRHYPQVLPQYLPNNIDPTTDIVQRIGEGVAAAAAAAGSAIDNPTTGYVPYDPYNDPALIDRIKTWPKEKQPFWFVNREAIKNHLGGTSSTRDSATTVQ